VLDTDAEAFGGFGRIQQGQLYPVSVVERLNEQCFAIRLYLPARTAVVIRRTPPGGKKTRRTTSLKA
jgi:hypothetical protein